MNNQAGQGGQDREVRYAVIPGLGRVRWHAYGRFAELVREYENNGELDRIKNMKQLGVLSLGLDCAHHTRFEYLALCLYLVDIVGASGGASGLARNVLIENAYVAKKELIKTWFLLLQCGHLYETYAAERLLLEQLHLNDDLVSTLSSSMPDEVRGCFREVIDKGDWYGLGPFLAWARLDFIGLSSPLKQYAYESLLKFVRGNSGVYGDAKRYYQAIRRIAFLHLDLQFTARSVVLDPIAIALQMHEEENLCERLLEGSDPRANMLNALSEYLCETAYVTSAGAERVAEWLQEGRHAYKIRLSTRDENVRKSALKELWEGPMRRRIRTQLRHVFSLPARLSSGGDLKTEEKYRGIAGRRYMVYAARWPIEPRYTEVFFLARDGDRLSRSSLSCRKIYNLLKELRDDWCSKSDGYDTLWRQLDAFGERIVPSVSKVVEGLAAYLLREVLGSRKLEVRSALVRRHRAICVPWFICKGLKELRAAAAQHREEMVAKYKGGSLVAEAEAIKDVIERIGRRSGFYLFGRGPFFLRVDNMEKEVDGIVVRVDSCNVTVYVMEAKGGRTGQGALNELRRKVRALGLSQEHDAFIGEGWGVLGYVLT